MTHDDRNIPLDYEPPRPEWTETAKAGIARLLAERNRREKAVLRRRDKENAEENSK